MKKRLNAVILISTVIANSVLLPQALASFNGKLSVRVDGIKSQKGQICLNVFANSKGFPDNGKLAVLSQCVKVTETSQTVTFPNLKAGNYAVTVIHDTVGNGALKRNPLGIPTGGFGFSNNPAIRFGPPKFGDSTVFVAGVNTNIQIKLQYLLGG
ncbi:hypothetical protein NIES4071_11730 [Calothrix sp. NIES-4071]|nr:hypothetical protein NIES4071_11730 [Calothrix sp. NIES-4071]BAZ55513.1 hypothetical protein NIES4105_11690 [Calothrix sp. NIES-4105]